MSEMPEVALWWWGSGRDYVCWEIGMRPHTRAFAAAAEDAERIVLVDALADCARDDDAWAELRKRLQEGTL